MKAIVCGMLPVKTAEQQAALLLHRVRELGEGRCTTLVRVRMADTCLRS